MAVARIERAVSPGWAMTIERLQVATLAEESRFSRWHLSPNVRRDGRF